MADFQKKQLKTTSSFLIAVNQEPVLSSNNPGLVLTLLW